MPEDVRDAPAAGSRLAAWARRLSLRTRLLALTLALAAAGLAIAGGVTYALLRSSLIDRVDAQLRAAQRPAFRAITEGRFGGPFGGGPRPGLGDLPLGTHAGIFDSDGDPVVTPIGATGDLPLGSGPGFYSAAVPGGDEFRWLRTPVSSAAGELDFVVGVPLGDVNRTLDRLLVIELLVGLGVLGAIAGAGLWLVRLGLKPLSDIEATAAQIASGDLSRRIEEAPPSTEVGRLGGALNTMLGTIEDAFKERTASEQRLRQFVADASHELQTPLTSVRGYAELFRRGAADRPEDLANAMSRIEAESERMGLLVDDLLLLARLDQGRPMAREQVDLAAIAREIAGDAKVVDPDRPITIDAAFPVTVWGDEARLRQVVANLVNNARVHTPTQASVIVRVVRDGDDAILEVRDHGPGMSAEHAARAFERFFRADASRARASGGSGLGLAIVAAIVDAHGGTVAVDTSPGAGARFRVTLPVVSSPASLRS